MRGLWVGLVGACLGFAQSVVTLPAPAAVAMDSSGGVYLAGTTSTANVATTPGVFQATPPGGCPATGACGYTFIAKLAASGRGVAWASYLNAGAGNLVEAMEVGPDGNVYVAGAANSAGVRRRFVAKVKPDGTAVLGEIFWGGSGSEWSKRIAFDRAGNVFVAGTTASTDFPTTEGAYQRRLGASKAVVACTGDMDEFVTKFDPALKTILYSTYVGTPAAELLGDFAIGPDDSMYLAGTRRPIRDSPCGAALLLRLNAAGSAAIYSTESAGGYALAVDRDGNAYTGFDDRTYVFSGPLGSVVKVDAQGSVTGRFDVYGYISSLRASSGGLTIVGDGSPGEFRVTADAPGVCRSVPPGTLLTMPYLARLDTSTMKAEYASQLNATLWNAGADHVVAAYRFGKFPTYAVLPTGPPPAGMLTCIASAATYESKSFAPGELVSLFGTGIGPEVAVSAERNAEGGVSTELGGMRVLAGGAPAPILYAGPNQINLIMPFGVSGESTRLQVYRGTTLLGEFENWLADHNPAFFGMTTQWRGPLAALNQDGTVNGAANPAAAGSVITVFATGLGTMTPLLADGAVADTIVNRPAIVPQVMAGQEKAEVLYMGNAPGLVQGVVQINLRLPMSASGAVYVGVDYGNGVIFWGGTVWVGKAN